MTYEFSSIVAAYQQLQARGIRAVLATLVELEGSSYRRPGVQMLFGEDGTMVGALSGGCIEQEVFRSAQKVFNGQEALVIEYDGRYRLGCEGKLWILIEPLVLSNSFLNQFSQSLEERSGFRFISYFEPIDQASGNYGSGIQFENSELLSLRPEKIAGPEKFERQFDPVFRLLICGGEHDAAKMTALAAAAGWQVELVVSPRTGKKKVDYPGAHKVHPLFPEQLSPELSDANTAVVVMTHSFNQDLKFLLSLIDHQPAYLGVLGAAAKRDRLVEELVKLKPELSLDFFDLMRAPAGLDIGAETPEEIALAIMAEILAVVRKKSASPLNEVRGKIHQH